MLMRCSDGEQAQAVFDRFRRSMAAFAFPQVGTTTVSIGISQLLPRDTLTRALDRPDQAVSAAKSVGRWRGWGNSLVGWLCSKQKRPW